MKKLAALIVVLLLVAGLFWLVWFRPMKGGEPEAKVNPEVSVHAGKITRATLHGYVTAYGSVEPEPGAGSRVAATTPGVVAAVTCAEGQRVEKGALLFQLDSRAAEVAVTYAEKTLERQKKLTLVEGTSQKLLQDAEQQVAAARAQQNLLQIRAPLAGIVTKVNVRAGEAADLTTVLAEMIDPDRLVVSASVPGYELALLTNGQPAEVSTTESTKPVNASLTFISPQVDSRTGAGLARVSLPAGSGLRPGQFATVRIVYAESKDCLAVPSTSVAKDATGAFFIALVQGEKAVLKPVKVGLRDGDLVQVEGDGVEPDTAIVTEGAYGLVAAQQFATKIRVVGE